jgi:hypothetical protein
MTANSSKLHGLRVLALAAAVGAVFSQPALAVDYQWTIGGNYPYATTLNSVDTLEITDGGAFSNVGLTTDAGSVVTWSAGNLTLNNNNVATVINNGGTWNDTSTTSLSIGDNGGYNNAFNNSGLLENTGTGTLTVSNSNGNLTFTNNSGGTISAGSGATILFSGSGNTWDNFANNSYFSGNGTITIGGGGASFAGAQNIASTTTFNFSGSAYVGASTGTGTQINGNANWNAGAFTGTWTLPATQTLTVNTTPVGSTAKTFAGGTFTVASNGTVNWNTGDAIVLSNGGTAAVVNNNGNFNVTATTTLEDGGGYNNAFNNNGTLQETGASGSVLTIDNNINNLTFTNSTGATISAATGDTVLFAGNGATWDNFASGSNFSGNGTITIGGGGATFTGAQNIASTTTFNFSNGSFVGSAAQINGNANWNGGRFTGSWTVPGSQTLTVNTTPVGSTAKTFADGTFTVASTGTVNWNTGDTIVLSNGGTAAVVNNNGNFNVTATTTMEDGGGYNNAFNNNGTLQETGASGSVLTIDNNINNLTFTNSTGATISAATGDTVLFAGNGATWDNFASGSNFSGNGTITIGGGGATFTGAQNIASTTTFNFSNGSFVGSAAQINGNANWNGGRFTGSWTVPGSQTLTVNTTPVGSTAKTFADGTFTVASNGTVNWNTSDFIVLSNGGTAAVVNNNGNFNVNATTTMEDGGGYNNAFNNYGTLQETGASGSVLTISNNNNNLTFTNNTGATISAAAGNTVLFAGNGNTWANFNNNSNFSGNGTITIGGGGATFTGAQNIASNTTFNFTGVNFNGAGTGAQLIGNANWSGGAFSGTWTIAAGDTLTVNPTGGGNAKTFSGGSFTNNGTINWNTNDNISLNNTATVTNGTTGIINVAGNASVVTGGGYNNTIVNNGLFEKTSGTTTSISDPYLTFTNNGTMQVLNGTTIAMGTAFTNPGTLAGIGTFTAGTLTNNGHVAPGIYQGLPGTLNLTGNYVQGSGGFLDIGLNNSATGLLLVTGTASLAGTLDVNCVGSCTFAAGNKIEVLGSSGLTGDFTSVDATGFTITGGTNANIFTTSQIGGNEYLTLNDSVSATAAAVPEPDTYALMLAGCGVIFVIARRRRSRDAGIAVGA